MNRRPASAPTAVAGNRFRALVLLAGLILAACRGGGGGGQPPTPTRTPTQVAPVIQSVIPTEGLPGTLVLLTGSGFTGAVVDFAGSPALPELATDTALEVRVPAGAGSGPIQVSTAAGAIRSQSFTVLAPPAPPPPAPLPVVLTVAPLSGSPGERVVLTGTGFPLSPTVTFFGTPAVVVTATSSRIETLVPDGAQSGPITVARATGGGASQQSFTVLPPPPALPTIQSVAPLEGVPGTLVEITGTGLAGASVTFAGTPASLDQVTPTRILARVPAAASGTLAVTTAAGTVPYGVAFTILEQPPALPAIDTVEPAQGSPDSPVLITGSGFTGQFTVSFAGTAAAVLEATEGHLLVLVPDGAGSGPVLVTTAAGTAPSPQPFTVLPRPPAPPVLQSVSPESGRPGTPVVILGLGLVVGDESGTAVAFGGIAAVVLHAAPTQLDVLVPDAALSGPVTVTTSAGQTPSPRPFTVLPALILPVLQTVQPDQGPPGTRVTLTGTGLAPNPTVTFAGTLATVLSATATRLEVEVPVGAQTGFIRVAAGDGEGVSSAPFTVTLPPVPPSIGAILPAQGTPGTLVTITGTGFTATATVAFAGQSATILLAGPTQLQVRVPDGAQTGPVTVTTVAGSNPPGPAFTVLAPPPPPPRVRAMNPLLGSTGDRVTLDGSDFTGVQSVTFAGTAATIVTFTATRLVVLLPEGAQSGPVRVTTATGSSDYTLSFRVVPLVAPGPVVDDFSPRTATVRSQVFLFGSNFTGATQVSFNEVAAPVCFVITDDSLMTVVPAGASTGPIRVTTPEGSNPSTRDFTVLPGDPPAPVVRSLLPDSGRTGDSIRVAGSNFYAIRALAFPGVADVPFTVITDSLFRVEVPAGARSGPLTLTQFNGAQTSTPPFTVTTAATLPVITDFDPKDNTGPQTLVRIVGQNLALVTGATIGGQPVSAIPVSDTVLYLSLLNPNLVTGPIVVTSPAGSGTHPTPFTVVPPAAAIRDFTPDSGSVGTPVTIRGNFADPRVIVWFNGIRAQAPTYISNTEIRALVPLGASSGPLLVQSGAAQAASRGAFTVVAGRASTLAVRITGIYITQATQRMDGSVPLVAGHDGLLRVFLEANEPNDVDLTVRVSLRDRNGNLAPLPDIPQPPYQVPLAVQETPLARSWNLAIPGQYLQPGSTLLAEIRPNSDLGPLDPRLHSFPSGGTPQALRIQAVPPFAVTLVPINNLGSVGNVNGGGRTLESWVSLFRKVHPVQDVTVRQGSAFTPPTPFGYNSDSFRVVRNALEAKRFIEDRAGWTYYCGVFQQFFLSPLEGIGDLGGTAGQPGHRSFLIHDEVGRRDGSNYPEVFVHEIGHNFGRYHAPSGGAQGTDPLFPDPLGGIGSWGLDLPTRLLKRPDIYRDFMGYGSPVWVSPYTWTGVMNWRSQDPMDPAPAAPASGRSLLVWGTITDGQVQLQPAFQVERAAWPITPGDYRLTCTDAQGKVLATVSFDAALEPDQEPGGDARSFFLTLSMTPELEANLATLEIHQGLEFKAAARSSALLRRAPAQITEAAPVATAPTAEAAGPGRVRLTWDASAHPAVLIQDPATGEIIAMGAGGSQELATDARALNLILSDGVRSRSMPVTVPD